MKKIVFGVLALLVISLATAYAANVTSDMHYFKPVEFRSYLEFPEITAPGNPATNKGRLYTADSGGTTTLYFKDSAGTATNLLTAGATAWSDIGNPTVAKTVTFSTYATTLTSAKTNGDMFTIQGTGNFGDYAVLHVKQLTGNPTDGTILQVTSADTDADALKVTANSIDALKVNGAGTITLTGKVTGATGIVFEGATADGTNVNNFAFTDPTAARTTTFPDATGTIKLNATATKNWGGAHADWTLSVNEQEASYITGTNADAGVNVLLTAARPGSCYFVNNASGQIITFKVTGQTGGTIANGKRAFYCSDAVDVYEIWEQS